MEVMEKMKLSNIFFIVFIVVLLFILGCSKKVQISDMGKMTNEDKTSVNEDLEFKKMCQNAGYDWMFMKPTKDGKIIETAKSCMGCMVEGIEHLCNKEKFMELMKTGMKENSMGSMDSMMQNAMTAHGGISDSVDVHSYKVGFARSNAQVGKESLLKFTINEIGSGKPVSDLEIVHEKIMHVVLVRNDLKYFDHIHPQMAEPGNFTVAYNFSSPGTYRIWADFTIGGMQHIVDFGMNVAGNAGAEEKDMLDGLKVNFNPPEGIVAGKELELKFEIFDNNSKPIPVTEKFLGATAHLIEIDENLEEFGHNHDENFDKDNIISFRHVFAKPGRHKIWVQFLKEGKTKTASFELMVK